MTGSFTTAESFCFSPPTQPASPSPASLRNPMQMRQIVTDFSLYRPLTCRLETGPNIGKPLASVLHVKDNIVI